MNRDELAALVRGVISVAAGALLLSPLIYVLCRWIGWVTVLLIGGGVVAAAIAWLAGLPLRWRPW